MIIINGFEVSHYAEDISQEIIYTNNVSIVENTDANHRHIQRNKNHLIYLNFNSKIYSAFSNIDIVDLEDYDASKINVYNKQKNVIKPFNDKDEIITKRIKKILLQSYNSVSRKNEDNKVIDRDFSIFVDRENHTINDISYEENIDEINDYPISYNIVDIFNLDGRISPIKNVIISEHKKNAVDDLLGIRGYTLGNSKNAFQQNLVISDKYEKEELLTYSFLDDVDENFLRNMKQKRLISNFDYIINEATNEEEIQITYRYKNIHSNNVMYFNYSEKSLKPFREKNSNKNAWWVDEESNRYKLLNDEINESILTRRSLNNHINESIIYSARGRDINLSSRSTRESITYYERLN